jgi:hypothetical protein
MKTVQITIKRSRNIECDMCDSHLENHLHHLVFRGDDWDFLAPILGDADELTVDWTLAHSVWLWEVAPELYAWCVRSPLVPRVQEAEPLALHARLMQIVGDLRPQNVDPDPRGQRYIEGHHLGDVGANIEWRLRVMLFGCYPQDGSFVRETGRHFDPLNERGCELHAPAKQGLLARYEPWAYHAKTKVLTVLFTRAEARANAAATRTQRRIGQTAYEARRLAAGEALANGQGLPWHHGQEGGYVEFGGVTVSARGALRAAGRARNLIDSFYGYVSEIESMCDARFGRWSYTLQWDLFIDGAIATAPDGTRYAFGSTAQSLLDRAEPTDPRMRTSHGKIAWYVGRFNHPLAPSAEQRRTSKRLSRRAERRNGRAELSAMI